MEQREVVEEQEDEQEAHEGGEGQEEGGTCVGEGWIVSCCLRRRKRTSINARQINAAHTANAAMTMPAMERGEREEGDSGAERRREGSSVTVGDEMRSMRIRIRNSFRVVSNWTSLKSEISVVEEGSGCDGGGEMEL